ncbi:MAG: hypothetical protein AAF724_22000 [Pseudomonadota bacterium]
MAYATGNAGAAHLAWARYEQAIYAGNYSKAADLVSDRYLNFEGEQRKRALLADENEMIGLPILAKWFVANFRSQVYDGSLSADTLRNVNEERDFHASWLAAGTERRLPHGLMFVLPLGPKHAIGWFGPKGDFSLSALVFAMALDMRVNFHKENDTWRFNVLPAMEASIAENQYYFQGDVTGKQLLSLTLAPNDAAKQRALWKPID